jgi:hypothetical protein
MVVMVRSLTIVLIATCAIGAAASHAQIVLPDPVTHGWLRTWIPVHCCVTNNCCFSVSAADVEPMPEDSWKIRATGQVLGRTNWSPDGRWWRCACDNIDGKWVVHTNANTRCIFPPMQSVMATVGLL